MATALYPGAFKPPHRGHFEVVKKLLDGSHGGSVYGIDDYQQQGTSVLQNSSGDVEPIDKVVIFIGGGVRNGINQEEAADIWKVYTKYLDNVEVVTGGNNPMMDAKEYAKSNPNDDFYAITGIRSEDDIVDMKRITTFKNRPNVEGLVISGAKEKIRATDFRKAILSGELDKVTDFFPEELSNDEISFILSDLKDSIIAEMIGNNFTSLIEAFTDTSEYLSPSPNLGHSVPVASKDTDKIGTLYNYLSRLITNDVNMDIHGNSIILSLDKPVQEEVVEEKYNYAPMIASITEYMIDEGMKISPIPEVIVKWDPNQLDFFGRTAYYKPQTKEVVLYAMGRHPKDVVRSYAHEMVHHIQNLEGRLQNITTTNTNEDGALEELEKEAYTLGNITFRNWEDKQKNS